MPRKKAPGKPAADVRLRAETVLPTRRGGPFRLKVYGDSRDRQVLLALVKGDIDPKRPTLVRLHSQCLTGDVFGSERCDCGEQLDAAMKLIGETGAGVLVYMFDEGRGIGLLNKIRAYALQDEGADTVEANEKLGFAVDARNYQQCVEILRDLGLKKVKVLSNNPEKIQAMRAGGLEVVERVPIEFKPSKNTIKYLTTKKLQMGHLLQLVS